MLQHLYQYAITSLGCRQAEAKSAGWEKEMSDPIVYGFPRSTFVQIVRLVLTHKNVTYTFRDLEPEMGKSSHLALHPFNRVPILQHGDFTVYETSAIVNYVEETFDNVALRPASPLTWPCIRLTACRSSSTAISRCTRRARS